MSRSVEARVADVRRLLAGARAVYADRARITAQVARCTGLTSEGVELGFASLERDASDEDLEALVVGAGRAEHVHAVLSANVFVAPLRAIAIARAAAERVTIRPSPRDPVLARALVDAARDDAIAIVSERDIGRVVADEVHVYGRDETISAVRARTRPGTVVRGHGAGMGVAIVTLAADIAAEAELLAADVVPFDQRGCLSPRIAIVEGDATRARTFARLLDECLCAWGRRVPRGALFDHEPGEAIRWRDTMAFVGRVWTGDQHTVALGSAGAPAVIPPAGRHVHVVPEPTLSAVASRLATIARFVVAVGSDDPARVGPIVATHARVSRLGRMQRPPLDGPVDRRSL
jgi:hypothetical protein